MSSPSLADRLEKRTRSAEALGTPGAGDLEVVRAHEGRSHLTRLLRARVKDLALWAPSNALVMYGTTEHSAFVSVRLSLSYLELVGPHDEEIARTEPDWEDAGEWLERFFGEHVEELLWHRTKGTHHWLLLEDHDGEAMPPELEEDQAGVEIGGFHLRPWSDVRDAVVEGPVRARRSGIHVVRDAP